jgi:hypothetical protein
MTVRGGGVPIAPLGFHAGKKTGRAHAPERQPCSMVRLRTVTPSLKACFAALFLSPTFAFAFDFPGVHWRDG